MSLEDLKKEIDRLDRNIDAFNFVKSIVRVFSLYFMNYVDCIGGWKIEELCGTGSNGVVFTARQITGCADAADGANYLSGSGFSPLDYGGNGFESLLSDQEGASTSESCRSGEEEGFAEKISGLVMAFKIPNLSHFIVEWFDLSEEHMFDPPHEKFAEVTDEILRTFIGITRETKEVQSRFQNIEEEKSYKREFYSLEAIGCTEKGVRYLEDYGTFDLVLRQGGKLFRERCFSYFVTPLFPGITMTAYFSREMEELLRWRKAVELLGGVIDIVDHVHRQDIIHRDLHPKNFLYNEESGELNLIDFGSSFPHRDASLDMPGQRRGSKRYMSPEQYRDPREVDIRSDFFFIGGLFQFMLTRRTPHLRTRTVETLPLLPEESLQDVRSIPAGLVRDVSDFIRRLLSYNREERYQSLEEIRAVWQKISSEVEKLDIERNA